MRSAFFGLLEVDGEATHAIAAQTFIGITTDGYLYLGRPSDFTPRGLLLDKETVQCHCSMEQARKFISLLS